MLVVVAATQIANVVVLTRPRLASPLCSSFFLLLLLPRCSYVGGNHYDPIVNPMDLVGGTLQRIRSQDIYDHRKADPTRSATFEKVARKRKQRKGGSRGGGRNGRGGGRR